MVAIVLLIAVIAVSTSAPLITAAWPAPALTVAALRVLCAALILSMMAGTSMTALTRLRRQQLLYVLGSGFLLAMHFGVWISSLYLTSTAASVALVATQPVFAGLLGWMFLGDRARVQEVIGIAIVSAGCVALAAGDLGRGSAALGDLLAIMGAMTAAAYLVLGRRLRNELPLLPYLALVNWVAGGALLGAAFVAEVPLLGFPAHVYLAILACALVPSVVGHTLLNWSVRRVPAHMVSLAILGEPIGASLLSWWFHNEVPPGSAVLGGLIILLGIAVGLFKPRGRVNAQPK